MLIFCGVQKSCSQLMVVFSCHKKNYCSLLLLCLLSHLTSSTHTKYNLYLANSLAAAVRELEI